MGAALAMTLSQGPNPVLWLNLRGDILVAGKQVKPQVSPGVSKQFLQPGVVYNFFGPKGGILFGDLPDLALSGSITVSAWLMPNKYVTDGPGAQILFRGDDRNGLDPYSFTILGDGTVNFGVQNENQEGMVVKAEIPLNKWTHVTASFNANSGELMMYINGTKTAYAKTSKRPLIMLDRNYAPGIGVGNVQNNHGPHNQPYRGLLADLRLYSAIVSPEEAGYDGPKNVERPPLLALRTKLNKN